MKKGVLIVVVVCLIFGILLLTAGKDENVSTDPERIGIALAHDYKSELERICGFMCSSLDGVETANVNITLDGSMRYVYARNSEGSYGGTYFSSGGEPLLLNYDYPDIIGCAVMCSGAITDQKKLEITNMLCAYLGIPSNKLYVGYIG